MTAGNIDAVKGRRAILLTVAVRPDVTPQQISWYLSTFFGQLDPEDTLDRLDQVRQLWRAKRYADADSIIVDLIAEQETRTHG